MFSVAPGTLFDLFALASASSVTLGTAWFLVRLAKAIVPSAVDYLSRRRLLRTIERLAASPPPARIELTSQGFVFDPYLCDAPVGRPGSSWLFVRSVRPPYHRGRQMV
jgi:hypothetical protein